MVGVPRSKGCRICVARRVKCDQTKPTCNNCKKGNRPCPGYGQDLKFQDEGDKLRKRYQKQKASSSTVEEAIKERPQEGSPPDLVNSSAATTPESDDELRAFISGNDHWDVVGLDIHTSNRRTFLGLLEGKQVSYLQFNDAAHTRTMDASASPVFLLNTSKTFMFHNFSEPALPPIHDHVISPNIHQDQMLAVFKSSMSPETMPGMDPGMRNHGRWLSHLPPLTGTNPLLDTAVRAVTLVHIGRLRNLEAFVFESRPYYGRALRLLNVALMDDEQGMSSETLCATILLSFYEMFASDSDDSWIRHAGGAGALMKIRGPQRHRRGFDREIFLAYRYSLVVEAFQRDIRCFLDEPEWREVANVVHDDLKASGVSQERVEVFDLAEDFYGAMVKVPAILSACRRLRKNLPSKDGTQIVPRELERHAKAVRTEFKHTFTRFQAALNKAGHAPTISVSQDPIILMNYNFINTFLASTYTGYWTVLTILDACLLGLESESPQLKTIYAMENRESALNICRCTASMLRSSFLGPFFVIFGLRAALFVFEDETPESDWVLLKLLEIGDRFMSIARDVSVYRPGLTEQALRAKAARAKFAASAHKVDLGQDMPMD